MTDPTALPTFGPAGGGAPEPVLNDDLRDRVVALLNEFGTSPETDADGDIAFTADENRLFVRTFPGDLQAMQVSGHWTVPPQVEGDVAKQQEACNNVNMGMHLVKCGIVNGTLVVAVELVTDSDQTLPGMLHLSISSVLTAVRVWHEQVLGLEPGSTFPRPEGEDAPQTPEA